MLLVVLLPGTIDDVGMKRVGLWRRHMKMGESKLRRIRETRHSLVPMSSGQHNRIPLGVDFGRSVAQIRNRAIQNPRAAAVESRRMTTVAQELPVECVTCAHGLFAGSLSRRFRDRRHYIRRSWEG